MKLKGPVLRSLLLLIVILGFQACGSQSANGADGSKPELAVGIIPFDISDPASFVEAADTIKSRRALGFIIHNVTWATPCNLGEFQNLYKDALWMSTLPGQGLDLVYAMDFLQSADRSQLNIPPNCAISKREFSFTNPIVIDGLVKEAQYVANTFHPKYLAIGVEVEEFFARNNGEVQGFKAAFKNAYDAVKKIMPDTTVFFYAQYENLAKLRNRWDAVNQLLNGMTIDAFGVSSYPEVLQQTGSFPNASAMDNNYYAPLWANVPKQLPIIFAELGASVTKSSIYDPGSNPANDQNIFMQNFFSAISGRNVKLVSWINLHDSNLIDKCDSSCHCTPWNVFSSPVALFFSGFGLEPDKCGPARTITTRPALETFFAQGGK